MKKTCTLAALLIIFALNTFSNEKSDMPRTLRETRLTPEHFSDRYDRNSPERPRAMNMGVNILTLHRNKNTSPVKMLEYLYVEEGWKDYFVYDEHGNTAEIIEQDWNTAEQEWENYHREVWSWDADGWPTLCLEYSWDFHSQEWVKKWKSEVERDGLTLSFTFYHLNPDWVPTYKQVIIFNEDLNMLAETWYVWENSEDWIPEDRYVYDYDEHGRLELMLESFWDGNEWMEDWKEEYHYDGNQLTILAYYYEEPYPWVKVEKTEALMDDFGDMIEATIYDWLAYEEEWESFARQINTINYDYTIDDLLMPHYVEVNHMISLVEFLFRDEYEDDFVSNFVINFHYTDLVTTVQEIETTQINVFPNPASGLVNITIPDTENTYHFYIYDVQGRTVMSKQVTSSLKISLIDIPSGLYVYSIRGQKYQTTGKLLVR